MYSKICITHNPSLSSYAFYTIPIIFHILKFIFTSSKYVAKHSGAKKFTDIIMAVQVYEVSIWTLHNYKLTHVFIA